MIAKKEEYRILLWTEDGNFVRFADGQFRAKSGSIDLQHFLPLTEDTKNIIKMMYPTLDTERLQRALTSWESFDVKQDDLYLYNESGRWI